jgi:hypothetical protein
MALLQELFNHITGPHFTATKITFQHPFDSLLLALHTAPPMATYHTVPAVVTGLQPNVPACPYRGGG